MSPDARHFLLLRARSAIASHLAGEDMAVPDTVPEDAEVLSGCFVTLLGRDGALRGCIGTFETTQPLWHSVQTMAVAAATRDPRFEPLLAEELRRCTIDISALTPPSRAHPTSVEVGVHGVVVEGRGRRGVLLPQVATDRGWDRETFLAHTCRKAGLAPDAWQAEDVTISTFTAEVFAEAH